MLPLWFSHTQYSTNHTRKDITKEQPSELQPGVLMSAVWAIFACTNVRV